MQSVSAAPPTQSPLVQPNQHPALIVDDGHWKEATAADGKLYYYHAITKQTSWSKPVPQQRVCLHNHAELLRNLSISTNHSATTATWLGRVEDA